MGPEKLEAVLILRCNYDLWKGQIGQKLIQDIMNIKQIVPVEQGLGARSDFFPDFCGSSNVHTLFQQTMAETEIETETETAVHCDCYC